MSSSAELAHARRNIRNELVPGSGHDDRTHPLVLLEVQDGAAELVERLRVEGVQDARPVDRDERDRSVAIHEQVVKGHGDKNLQFTTGNWK